MLLGISAALFVFTGIWHMTEWLMGGRNKDTLQLIPFGIAYTTFGVLVAGGNTGTLLLAIALIVTLIGVTGALVLRKTTQIRAWVLWAFILIDVVIVAGLCTGLVAAF